ncbi:uncharacterized protein BJ171DRAFT_73466 [Polychytrium aggregatum]|uniref:uncharacterized protein n=1 Tax=Polychytrium aggregatum TaxID=110093 RepID=UPI0022FE7404|nr:uncharacterized protein BJ171DRAFT_73466 [Polychytrium aggregatum]KAI9205432.1 hypothetical protein BJ171DRAFT_73466 [Polychytrium aggregatum]
MASAESSDSVPVDRAAGDPAVDKPTSTVLPEFPPLEGLSSGLGELIQDFISKGGASDLPPESTEAVLFLGMEGASMKQWNNPEYDKSVAADFSTPSGEESTNDNANVGAGAGASAIAGAGASPATPTRPDPPIPPPKQQDVLQSDLSRQAGPIAPSRGSSSNIGIPTLGGNRMTEVLEARPTSLPRTSASLQTATVTKRRTGANETQADKDSVDRSLVPGPFSPTHSNAPYGPLHSASKATIASAAPMPAPPIQRSSSQKSLGHAPSVSTVLSPQSVVAQASQAYGSPVRRIATSELAGSPRSVGAAQPASPQPLLIRERSRSSSNAPIPRTHSTGSIQSPASSPDIYNLSSPQLATPSSGHSKTLSAVKQMLGFQGTSASSPTLSSMLSSSRELATSIFSKGSSSASGSGSSLSSSNSPLSPSLRKQSLSSAIRPDFIRTHAVSTSMDERIHLFSPDSHHPPPGSTNRARGSSIPVAFNSGRTPVRSLARGHERSASFGGTASAQHLISGGSAHVANDVPDRSRQMSSSKSRAMSLSPGRQMATTLSPGLRRNTNSNKERRTWVSS